MPTAPEVSPTLLDVDAFYREVGMRFSAARRDKGLTQAQLAADLQLSRTSIANLEAGRQRIPAHTLYAAALALKCGLDDLTPPPTDVAVASPRLPAGIATDTPAEHVTMLNRVLAAGHDGQAT